MRRWKNPSGFAQPALQDGKSHELYPARHAELAHAIGLVRVDGLDADAELGRHLSIGVALGEQPKYLPFRAGSTPRGFPAADGCPHRRRSAV